MSRYELLYHPLVVSRDIPRLDPPVRKRIRAAIEAKLTERPEASAKPLAYTTRRLWSLRVGDWRVIFALRQSEIWILKAIGAGHGVTQLHPSAVYNNRTSLIPISDP